MTNFENTTFRLDSNKTTYAFRVTETGHLEHLYYGEKLKSNSSFISVIPMQTTSIGNGVAYSEQNEDVFLETLCLETSTPGKGDYRNSAIVAEYDTGLQTLDFIYSGHKQIPGKPQLESGLGQSYAKDADASTLEITLKDRVLPINLKLYYTVFHKCDVIARTSIIENHMETPLTLKNVASFQLDLQDSDWDLISFDGAWARERHTERRKVQNGKTILESTLGLSGSSHNPCFFLARHDCSHSNGECYGFNLVYSGNYSAVIEKSPYGLLRIQEGINPQTFEWKLNKNEQFISPEAILTYSREGDNGASFNLHRFINSHIVRGNWKYRERPVLANNWEATYFNFNERRILELAKTAKDLGIELFVLDDGWFGERDNDRTSLGDWFVNTRKLPEGLRSISDKIHKMGMKFGLWVEPEMISRRSSLYGKHPDWAISIPGREPSVGRHQMILDLTRPEVRDFIVKTMTEVFKESAADYIKWDMNRTFSDIYSQYTKEAGTFSHKYIQGLCSILEQLTMAFPEILFENCASGGNRFDLGMLCYMSQTWTSDNTDVLSRTRIQEGTSYGYSISSMGAHVSSSPNQQTLRVSDIESRFNVAAFGVLGYEMDLCALTNHQREIIRKQISFYKEHRPLFQFGRFYRIPQNSDSDNRVLWAVSNEDASEAIVLDFRKENTPNSVNEILKVPFINPEYDYEVSVRPQKISFKTLGNLINILSPVQLGSLIEENIDFNSEKFSKCVSGEILAYAGIALNDRFSGTGFNKETRVMGDFGSRLYTIRKTRQ